jgi:eukaryotic-like serine/threonine-protein kinase
MTDRWRSWGRWLILTLLALGAAATTLLRPFGWDWPWLLAAVAGIAAVLAVPGKIMVRRIENAATSADEQGAALRIGALGAARVRVRDCVDPTELGVHRAVFPDGRRTNAASSTAIPVYVSRDAHEDVVNRLTAGTFVLIVGDSTAGKTRLAFEGRLAEAGRENRAVLAARETNLGASHPHTLAARHNLALVLRARSKVDETEN